MRAGEELRHLVVAVVDQRLVDAAEARSAVRRQIFDVERLDDIDHEVGAGDAADARPRPCGVPVSAAICLRGRRQGRRDARGARRPRRRSRSRLAAPRRRGAGDGHSGQEFAAIDLRAGILRAQNLACHGALPRMKLLCGDFKVRRRLGGDFIAGPCVVPGRRDYLAPLAPRMPPLREPFRPPSVNRNGAAKHLIAQRFQRVSSHKGLHLRAITLVPGSAQLRAARRHPRAAGVEGSVLVRALALGVCGTDREIVSGAYGEAPPGQRAAGARPRIRTAR